jgi:hypothetical protein
VREATRKVVNFQWGPLMKPLALAHDVNGTTLFEGTKRHQQAINGPCSLAGSVVLARVVDDPSLSDEILAAVRTSIEKSRNSRIAEGEK